MVSATEDISITITMEQASALLNRLARQATGRDEEQPIAVTRDGVPVFALVPWDLYESLVETVELLSDRDAVQSLRTGIAEAERGDCEDLDDVRADLSV